MLRASKILSLIKTKVSPVLTAETQTKSLLGGLFAGTASGTLSNLIGSLNSSNSQPSVSSLLNSLLSGHSLNSANMSNLLIQLSGSSESDQQLNPIQWRQF